VAVRPRQKKVGIYALLPFTGRASCWIRGCCPRHTTRAMVLKPAGTRIAASFCPRSVYRLRPVATLATATLVRLRFLSAVRDGRNSSVERGFRNRNAGRTAVKSSGLSDRSLAKISEAMPCNLDPSEAPDNELVISQSHPALAAAKETNRLKDAQSAG